MQLPGYVHIHTTGSSDSSSSFNDQEMITGGKWKYECLLDFSDVLNWHCAFQMDFFISCLENLSKFSLAKLYEFA